MSLVLVIGVYPQQMRTSADTQMSSILEHCLLLQCFVVSTLVSMAPANPFIFRNYELSPGSTERARQVCFPFFRASSCVLFTPVMPASLPSGRSDCILVHNIPDVF